MELFLTVSLRLSVLGLRWYLVSLVSGIIWFKTPQQLHLYSHFIVMLLEEDVGTDTSDHVKLATPGDMCSARLNSRIRSVIAVCSETCHFHLPRCVFVVHLASQLRRLCITSVRQHHFLHCPVRIGVCGATNQHAVEQNVHLREHAAK